ncbi:MAG: hypothetical protein Fur0042_11250 [Cyanophyceae cyanobacterium]
MQTIDFPFSGGVAPLAVVPQGDALETAAIAALPMETQPLLAQQFKDPDLMGQVQRAWSGFVNSGQIWALIIGLIIGYTFRKFST